MAARLQETFQKSMAHVLSRPLDLHRLSLRFIRRSRFFIHWSQLLCAGFFRARVLDCGDPSPGPCYLQLQQLSFSPLKQNGPLRSGTDAAWLAASPAKLRRCSEPTLALLCRFILRQSNQCAPHQQRVVFSPFSPQGSTDAARAAADIVLTNEGLG